MVENHEIHAALLGWHAAADQGLVQAQYVLGCMYCQGHGVERNYVVAMKWYLMAAHHGDGDAQYAIGIMFQQGHGVAQSDEVAARWISMASDKIRSTAFPTYDWRRREQVFAEEALCGAASPDVKFDSALSYEASESTAACEDGETCGFVVSEGKDNASGSSPLSSQTASENIAAYVRGETGGSVAAEDTDNTVAAAVDEDLDPSFNTEEPAAVSAASSMADSAADVAIEALTHQEGIIEFSDGSVYVGQTRLSDLGVIQCHGLGIK
jgi:hypothetical protein